MRSFVTFLSLSISLSLTLALFGDSTTEENEFMKKTVEESGYDGCILIYRLSDQHYLTNNPSWADQRFIPASTFKIFSSQVALETGIVENQDTIIKWDGIERSRSVTNQDLDLTTAFRVSAVPHFQQLVREIGELRMQRFLDEVSYGNRNLQGGIDQFWLTGGLRISPREQIGFLEKLYFDQLPFRTEVMQSVKEMMLTETDEFKLLRAKTGWAILDENQNFGWWVGWIETEEDVVFFATILAAIDPRDDFGSLRISLTKSVLQELYQPR